jgi:hypothetical protein
MKVNRCFGGICRLHIQPLKIRKPRKQQEAGSKQSVISQKIGLFERYTSVIPMLLKNISSKFTAAQGSSSVVIKFQKRGHLNL